jgi:phosphatidate cytidylyltransferase
MMGTDIDRELVWLVGGVLAVLVAASAVGFVLRRTVRSESGRSTVANLNARIRAWWVMCAFLAAAIVTGGVGSIVLFGVISFLALREFMTLVSTRPSDHRALIWIFFVLTPLQYLLVGLRWYGLYTILIPVYGFLLIPIRTVLRGDTERFLERTSEMQWGLMVCLYNVSYAPALLTLTLPGYEGQNAKLLLFFVLVVQASDVLQYIWGKCVGRHSIAPTVSPNKTWEGFLGGVGCAAVLGALLWWATPYNPWQAAAMSLVITLMGFGGGLVMSAVKRDLGVKDYGALIPGHGGILDRIDSISFAAPVFFHLTRYFFG